MEIAGLALSAVSAAPVLAEYGYRVYRRVQDKRRLAPLAQELRVFALDDRKNQLALLIELAQPVLRSRTIVPEHQERLVRTWERLKEQLSRVDELMNVMTTNSSIWDSWSRLEARNELIRIGSSGILTRLRNEFRDDVMMLREHLKDSSLLCLSPRDFAIIEIICEDPTFVRGRSTASQDIQWYLLETKPYLLEKKEEAKESIEILSSKLSKLQPHSGILPLLGYRDEPGRDGGAFQLIFQGPFVGGLAMTLSTFMDHYPYKLSLNFRVDLCYQLATAVLQTQLLGLVHKNIRPENILIHTLEAVQSPTAKPGENIPALSLCGWQYAREVEQCVTRLTGDVTLQRKIYQHPERQLPTADREYSMAHDVYSLGVCMLEILRWESVLQPSSPFVSPAFVETFTRLGFRPNEADPGDYYTKFPNKNKAILLSMSESLIPGEAGTKMTRIVCEFLTCLDRKGQELDEELNAYVINDEADRIKVAMNFVDTALKDLRSIQASI
ncbi:uncharacterized protein NECHADRAFT_81126 [Fusarium vanettenii 77-13-4]|uniref:Protein kinase domain-containing protein n=1 Tax=Fusarium vanettenii (strain ATCC MYA-4622 / CBS 123669 / FGSC 9596 / NRRL 45880 / 77-13-4) TaxID=660122 RepID=C7ZGQ4_FUSV7|nr:uncharacterized protein NECHADRAFT_81126 [Fusarium vanettenii 77-13-4]EEU36954.1 predicted protein [Fusarium vanettenii 77-13-4]